MDILLYLRFFGDMIYLALFSLWYFLTTFCKLFLPNKFKTLKGEIILVTGGSSGIGRAMCHELVRKEKDLTIIVWNTNVAKNESVVKELKELGAKNVLGQIVDVSDREQVRNAAKIIREDIGAVTMLFNNAGITGEFKSGWTMTPKMVQKVIGVNLTSNCWTLQEFIPSMIEMGKGHVVTTSSILGLTHLPFLSPYIASKHGLTAYSECIKKDIRNLPGKPKIHFTTSYPNVTETAMTEEDMHISKYPFLTYNDKAEEVAKRVIKGVLLNEEHIYFPWHFWFVPAFIAMCPSAIMHKLYDLLEFKLDPSRQRIGEIIVKK